MDPKRAIKERMREIEAELKLHKRALALYEGTVPATRSPYQGLKDEIVEFMRKHDAIEGITAKDLADGLNKHEFQPAVLRLLRGDRRFIQTNKPVSRNQRFRLKELVQESQIVMDALKPKTQKAKDEPVRAMDVQKAQARKARKVKPSTKSSAGGENMKVQAFKHQNAVREYLKTHKRVTANIIRKALPEIPATQINNYLSRLEDADVVKRNTDPEIAKGLRPRGSMGRPVGRPPVVYDSLIYDDPNPALEVRKEAVIRPGEGVSQGRQVPPSFR